MAFSAGIFSTLFQPSNNAIDKLTKMMTQEDKKSFANKLEQLLVSHTDSWELHFTLGELCEKAAYHNHKLIPEDPLKAAIFYRRALLLATSDAEKNQTIIALQKLHLTVTNQHLNTSPPPSSLDKSIYATLYHCAIALEAKKQLMALKEINSYQFSKLSAADAINNPPLFKSGP